MQDVLVKYIDNTAIKNLIQLRRKEYLQSPLRIVEDYNNENKNIDEYNGRQLLEMIQNANDESDTLKAKKVFIKLDEESLIIANNGNPFSLGGVESLMYSDLSPKTMEENKVGKKGLGFRSILNWSKEIYIASYDLHLKFSQKHAEDFLKSLLVEKPEIKETLNRKTKKKIPISVLRCPYLEKDTSKKNVKAYDTVVELTLRNGVYGSITEQIEVDIVPEILLFLNKLEEIEVLTPEGHFSFFKEYDALRNQVKIRKNDFLNPENNQAWNWSILEDKGEIKGLKETKNYELKIAYNPDEEVTFHKLFSFFRTKVDFPYPVIAHGSFELKSDRNQLVIDENGFNAQLIQKLAKLLVDCALKLTENETSNYDALKLLIPEEHQHSSLYEKPWVFDDLIKDSINKAAIFPTISNQYITIDDDAIFYEVKVDHLIPEEYYSDFAGFLKSTSDDSIINYLWQEHGDLHYYEEEFTERINKIIDDGAFSLEQKAEWVSLLSEHTKSFYFKKDSMLPNLLINTKGDIIKTGKEEIILPPKGEVYELPTELELQFVDRDFTEKLKERIGGDIRDLSTRLKVFQVDEYSMTVVARKIISGSHRLLNQTNNKSTTIVKGMHRALFHIYNTIKEDYDKASFFQNLPSPLLYSKNGKLQSANKLYFGKGYEVGYLCEHLLKNVNEDVFVGSLSENGLDNIPEDEQTLKIEKYLKWIGVADMPKRKILENNVIPKKQEYVNYIFDNLSFPYSLPYDNKTFETRDEIGKSFSHQVNVLWFDYFEEIMNQASIEFIISWFIRDRELYNCIVLDNEHDEAEFWMLFDNVRQLRHIDANNIRSYILFCLKEVNFIPVDDGKTAKPTECVANSGNLSPLVHSPQINYDADVFNFYNIKEDQVDIVLNRLGVKESFKDLSLPVMYNFLNRHHKYFNKDKSAATVLYNAIVDATSNLPKDFNWEIEERNHYLENGLVLSTVNGENEYVSIKESTYVLNPNHSQDLLAKLKVVKIRQRVGNTRIKELFGIEPIDYIEFKVTKPFFNQKLNNSFHEELNQLKPLLFVYRQQKYLTEVQRKRELSSLKQLKIKICYRSEIEYVLNEKTHKLDLKNNEFVFEKESHTYYIQVDDKTISYDSLKQDYRFTETISDIICGSIAVTENRKDFMLIIGQPQSKWREIMLREFPDFLDLENQVLKNFKGVLSLKQQFWKSVIKACKFDFNTNLLIDEKSIYEPLKNNIEWDDFFKVYRGLNYNEITKGVNFELMKTLFSHLGIDLVQFNRFSKIELNFSNIYKNKIRAYHIDAVMKFKSHLFSKGYSESFVDDIEYFESFDLDNLQMPSSIFCNIYEVYEAAIRHFLNVSAFQEEELIDVEGIFKTNLKQLKKLLREENILDKELLLEMQYDSKFKNNIYFSKFQEIIIKYKQQYLNDDIKRRTVKLSSEGVELDVEDDDKLIEEIEKSVRDLDLKIEHYVPERSEGLSNKIGNKKPRQSSNNLRSSSIPRSDIGFIGEKYAYELLKKQYDEVIWKSEYAIRAGFSGGTDGFGYDFECVKNGKIRFVEVKSTTSAISSFYISKNEVKIGHLKHSNYDILLINNLLSEEIRFRYLKNIFSYHMKDTFFENRNFLVEVNDYKIRFK